MLERLFQFVKIFIHLIADRYFFHKYSIDENWVCDVLFRLALCLKISVFMGLSKCFYIAPKGDVIVCDQDVILKAGERMGCSYGGQWGMILPVFER
ncbi:MAG: hypothetical protein C5S46_04215 [Candidatus Methanomarinus sp.]|uniref:Uncharacterized protein n=1 Tax=Candidatus Methanomarinus sp. TaxID=3386244 RepID=A0AC61SAS6_9EURY|nr:MAG: hypothetical protein C5S46_04215 [ANME-2 cluster archaeon]